MSKSPPTRTLPSLAEVKDKDLDKLWDALHKLHAAAKKVGWDLSIDACLEVAATEIDRRTRKQIL